MSAGMFHLSVPKGFDPASEIKQCEINPLEALSPPPTMLGLEQKGKLIPFATAQNITVISGKAKSRKSTFVTTLIAASISKYGKCFCIKHLPLKEQSSTLVFDTEQSHYHAQRMISQSVALAEWEGKPDERKLKVYSIKAYSPSERVQLIEAALLQDPSCELLVIDGVRDLVDDFNDPTECNKVVTKLLRWCMEYSCHIIVVLHENKTSATLRGHLGTELQNKAETVVKVEKLKGNDKISLITAEITRNEAFEPLGIRLSEETGLPELSDADPSENNTGGRPKSKKDISDYTEEELIQNLKLVFGSSTELNAANFKQQVERRFPNIKASAVRVAASALKTLGLIQTNGQANKAQLGYTLTEYAQNLINGSTEKDLHENPSADVEGMHMDPPLYKGGSVHAYPLAK